MNLQNLFLLALIGYISILEISAFDRSHLKYADVLRRFLIRYNETKQRNLKHSSNIIDNLVYPTSSARPSSSGLCSNNPCQHGGICSSQGYSSYECRCVGPWRGATCSVADACYKSPCKNGGTCANVYEDYWCKCTTDYYGNNCEKKFTNPDYSTDHCRSNPCKAGRCVTSSTNYYCQCPDDRYGTNCEKYIYKRNISKRNSFYNLLYHFKRVMNQDDENDERAFYDYKNGIYF